jgi:hypothetical protein
VVIDNKITSFALAVVRPANGKLVPVTQVPVALPSNAGAGNAVNNCNDNAPAGMVVDVAYCGDHKYMLEPADKVKDPDAWTIASQRTNHRLVAVPKLHD